MSVPWNTRAGEAIRRFVPASQRQVLFLARHCMTSVPEAFLSAFHTTELTEESIADEACR